MSKLNTIEQYWASRITATKELIIPGGENLQEDVDTLNVGVIQLVMIFREMYDSRIAANLDARKIFAALDMPDEMFNERGVIKLGQLLFHWTGAAFITALLEHLCTMELNPLICDLEVDKEPEVTELNPAKQVKVNRVYERNDEKRGKGEGKSRRARERALEEVLGFVEDAIEWSNTKLTATNHEHYSLTDNERSHIIDLKDANIRIIISPKSTQKTYILPLDIAGEFMSDILEDEIPEFEIDTERLDQHDRVKKFKKYSDHGFKLAIAINELQHGEKFDGCLTIDGEKVSSAYSISNETIKHCDRRQLSKKLKKSQFTPVIRFDDTHCPNLYKVEDIKTVAAELLGADSIEELDKIQVIKGDENGIAEAEKESEKVIDGEVQTVREKIKVLCAGPIAKRLKLKAANNITALLKRHGVEPIPFIRIAAQNKSFAYPYEESEKVLKEYLHGKDPFSVEVIRIDNKEIDAGNITVELDGKHYVLPRLDLNRKVAKKEISSNKREEIMKRVHAELTSHPTTLVLTKNVMREIFPLDEYNRILAEEKLKPLKPKSE